MQIRATPQRNGFIQNIIRPAERILSLQGIRLTQKLGLLFDLFRMPAQNRLDAVTTAEQFITKHPEFASQILKITEIAKRDHFEQALPPLSQNLQILPTEYGKALLYRVLQNPHECT